jgi:chromosome segregation ATPase
VLAERLEGAAARAAEYRVRLELTEQAESTLRAELEETRRRRDEVERERDELRRELEALRERRESRVSPGPSETTAEERTDSQEARETTQSAAETLRGPEPQPTTPGAQASPQRPPQAGRRRGRLWRRVFGG